LPSWLSQDTDKVDFCGFRVKQPPAVCHKDRSLTVSIGNQTIALYIDARLSDDVTLCASCKIALDSIIY